jgi:hypothetical protein
MTSRSVEYTEAGPRQHSHSWFRVPRDSRSYFTASRLLLASQRPTVSRPVSLGVKPHLGTKSRFLLLSDCCGFVDVGRPL